MFDFSAFRSDLIRHERLRLRPYRCTAGKLTIGYGRNLEDTGISAEEALDLLDNDINRVIAELDKTLPWWRALSPIRQKVLANMAFNLGIRRLLGFKKMLAALDHKRWAEAAREMEDSRWYVQVKTRAVELVEAMRKG